MRLLHVVALAVVVQGLLLYVQAVEKSSSQDLEKLLEEALQKIREHQEREDSESDSIKTDIEMLAANLTTVLEDLTEAIQNNTKALMKDKKGGTEVGGEGGAGGGREPSETVKCEPPFFAVKSECFYVNKYKRVSWSEARNFCKGLGSDLAEPLRVNSLRAVLLDKFPQDAYKFFWIGAMESIGEGNWTWLSSRPLQTSDWARGQPDGGNENCVVLSRDDYPPLHDSPCYTHTMFICERLILQRH